VNDYVIIPTRTVIWIGLDQFESTSFHLAIRAHGTTKWEYLAGDGITLDQRSRFFSDLKDTVLPEIKRKKLI